MVQLALLFFIIRPILNNQFLLPLPRIWSKLIFYSCLGQVVLDITVFYHFLKVGFAHHCAS